MQKKYFFLGLGLIPLLVGLTGIISLLKSPYLGIEFESRDGKWIIAAAPSTISYTSPHNLIGKEVISIGEIRLKKHDLEPDLDVIKDWDSYKRNWIIKHYLSNHIKIGNPISIRFNGENQEEEFKITPSQYPLAAAISKVWILFFVALVCIAIGLITVFKKQDDIRARIFFLFSHTPNGTK